MEVVRSLPVCFDCGTPCLVTYCCASCVNKRIEREGPIQWLSTLVGEIKNRYPGADVQAAKSTQKDTEKKPKSAATLKKEAKAAKVVHLSWFD